MSGFSGGGGSASFTPASFTNSLAADVVLNNTAVYFDGPSVAQGTTGTWFASGTVTCNSTSGAADQIALKLWDGTSAPVATPVGHLATNGTAHCFTVSGIIVNPVGNIRISVSNQSSTTGKIQANNSGLSKDSTISVFRIA